MIYARKLFIAKILVTLAMALYAFLPPLIDFGSSHIASDLWSPHARFHLTASLWANILAFPVLMYVVWGALHGTGRSVRLVAFLGMAYTLGFMVAGAMRGHIGADYHDPGREKLILGVDGNLLVFGLIFTTLLIAVLFSIRRAEKLQN